MLTDITIIVLGEKKTLIVCVHLQLAPLIFVFVFQLLRKYILQMGKPIVEGSLGSPPFEKPNIEQVCILSLFFLLLHLNLCFLCAAGC